ncbi:hypothetical protein [Bacillus safensis]|uniref:hypothetical protein n=1 Tax=Bacillus safensis TaxID=561879 RepID=UPI000ACCD90C|nr:hypothetical protein [Bacillus safensis]
MEFNVDRLWWTIGIILLGAILVGGAKVAFPEVFDSVVAYMKKEMLGVSLPNITITLK